jgi:hypothetical protein
MNVRALPVYFFLALFIQPLLTQDAPTIQCIALHGQICALLRRTPGSDKAVLSIEKEQPDFSWKEIQQFNNVDPVDRLRFITDKEGKLSLQAKVYASSGGIDGYKEKVLLHNGSQSNDDWKFSPGTIDGLPDKISFATRDNYVYMSDNGEPFAHHYVGLCSMIYYAQHQLLLHAPTQGTIGIYDVKNERIKKLIAVGSFYDHLTAMALDEVNPKILIYATKSGSITLENLP